MLSSPGPIELICSTTTNPEHLIHSVDHTIFHSSQRCTKSSQVVKACHGNKLPPFIPKLCQALILSSSLSVERLWWPTEDYQLIVIGERKHWAFVDNQASENVMTLEFARALNLIISSDSIEFEMVDGSLSRSEGRAQVWCKLAGERQSPFLRDFHIFAAAPRPLILGVAPCSEFAAPPRAQKPGVSVPREIVPCQPSLEPDTMLHTRQCISSPNRLQIFLRCEEGLYETTAVPDKGTSIDAMSLAFATAMKYEIDSLPSHRCRFTMTNGRVFHVPGAVSTSFVLGGLSLEANPFCGRFIVVDGLKSDICLGNYTLKKWSVFGKNFRHLVWTSQVEEYPLLKAYGAWPFLGKRGRAP